MRRDRPLIPLSSSSPGSPHFGRYRALSLLILGLLLAACQEAPSALRPESSEGKDVALRAWLLFAIAGVVFLVVLALIAVALRRSRRPASADYQPQPTDRRAVRWILFGGAVVPLVVLLIVTGLSIAIENTRTSHASTPGDIQVIGHQWWWEVRYPDLDVVTANEIHIPAGETVHFKLTSADVIHSFWVPELSGKLDLIPGQTNTLTFEADKPGVYRGQCAEYCGAQHANMVFYVIADAPDDFRQWVANQQQPAPEPPVGSLMQQGQQAFLGSACVYCHTIRGTNASGTIGPDLTHLASRSTIGAGLLENNLGNLAGWIVNSQALKPGNRMPPMDLDAGQVQAILTYLATLQ